MSITSASKGVGGHDAAGNRLLKPKHIRTTTWQIMNEKAMDQNTAKREITGGQHDIKQLQIKTGYADLSNTVNIETPNKYKQVKEISEDAKEKITEECSKTQVDDRGLSRADKTPLVTRPRRTRVWTDLQTCKIMKRKK